MSDRMPAGAAPPPEAAPESSGDEPTADQRPGREPVAEDHLDDEPFPDELPLLPLAGSVLFPLQVLPVLVGKERSIALVDAVMQGPRLVVVARQRDPASLPTELSELHEVGTIAMIHQLQRSPGGPVQLILQGVARVRLVAITQTEPFLRARFERALESAEPSVQLDATSRSVRDLFRQLVDLVPGLPEMVAQAVEAIDEPRDLAYVVSATAPLDDAVRQDLLEIETVGAKLRRLVELLQHEIAVRELGRKIQTDTEERMTDAQRKYFLREQLRTIRDELGEEEGAETRDLRERLERVPLPEAARKEAERELQRLEQMSSGSPETSIVRTYLEWLAELPWGRHTQTAIDVARAAEILDADHYGLREVKDRILEYLAVRQLRQARSPHAVDADDSGDVAVVGTGAATADAEVAHGAEPILCLVGPPGVGKTSLGRSVARALGRKFARIALGGVHDESEIRGHRRTYIGALPGRIVQALRRCESADPVFMLDEMDKLGQGIHGDPSSALLEVLDPAQNSTFTDTYLGVPFDLSNVLFIATANTAASIPRPLLDRMEVVELPGYMLQEKVQIARRYLLPAQRAAHALEESELVVSDETLRTIADEYTREAGVRQLDRALARLCRKVARRLATGAAQSGEATSGEVTPDALPGLLGRPRYIERPPDRVDVPGVATGLAWTPMGGTLLFVEAAFVPGGKGTLTLTGSLGDVMRESALAALTVLRTRADQLGIQADRFQKFDVHVHVPSGAIPKDGPSAGVTMTVALASAATGRKVRPDVAMTGEITLRGQVTPVGGVREKVLAAHRAGIGTVLLPRWNEPDLDDVPEELLQQIRVIPLDTIEQALDAALLPPEVAADVAVDVLPDVPSEDAPA